MLLRPACSRVVHKSVHEIFVFSPAFNSKEWRGLGARFQPFSQEQPLRVYVSAVSNSTHPNRDGRREEGGFHNRETARMGKPSILRYTDVNLHETGVFDLCFSPFYFSISAPLLFRRGASDVPPCHSLWTLPTQSYLKCATLAASR